MYKCPNCGGEMEFLPESGIIKCEYCGSEFSPETDDRLDKTRKKAEEHTIYEDAGEEGSARPGKVFTCSQCGASIYTLEDTGVTFCSYCGSQAFLESRLKGDENLMPDVVIPFQISKKQCEEIYKKKIKNAWFLPRAMRSDTTIEKFRGIYMPCWIYSGEAQATGTYKTSTTTRSGSYDIIKTYQVQANARGTYAGFVKDAAASFPDGIMREIAPIDLKSARAFNDKYLTGFYADVGNVPAKVYENEIYRSLDANVKNDLSDERNIRKYSVSAVDLANNTEVQSRITDVRKGFFPVWFLSNKNHHTGLMSYAVINGLNGKIHTDLPVDMKKYLLLSLLIAIPIFLILQFFTMKPMFLLAVTMLLLGILMFFSTKMIGDAYIQEHGLDDEGLRYLNRKGKKEKEDQDLRGQTETARVKTGMGKAGRIFLGILFLVGLPFLTTVFYALTDLNIIAYGFFGGIALFCVMILGGSGSRASFSPKQKSRIPFGAKLRAVLLPLIGILAGAFVLITQPVHDLYYYGAAVLCCVLLILTVLDFVRSNNRLSLRKPAQLGKRGGDENA